MKTKTFRGSEKKLNKIENYRKHFGWDTLDRDYDKLVMSYDKDKPHSNLLRKLEKEANIINSKFPKKMIVWTVLAILFFVPYFGLKDGVLFGALDLNETIGGLFAGILGGSFSWIGGLVVNFIPILLVVLGGVNAFFALYQFMVFWALKFSRHSTLEEIYRVADALSGNVIDAPLDGNIEPDGPYTGFIAILADKIGNRS